MLTENSNQPLTNEQISDVVESALLELFPEYEGSLHDSFSLHGNWSFDIVDWEEFSDHVQKQCEELGIQFPQLTDPRRLLHEKTILAAIEKRGDKSSDKLQIPDLIVGDFKDGLRRIFKVISDRREEYRERNRHHA